MVGQTFICLILNTLHAKDASARSTLKSYLDRINSSNQDQIIARLEEMGILVGQQIIKENIPADSRDITGIGLSLSEIYALKTKLNQIADAYRADYREHFKGIQNQCDELLGDYCTGQTRMISSQISSKVMGLTKDFTVCLIEEKMAKTAKEVQITKQKSKQEDVKTLTKEEAEHMRAKAEQVKKEAIRAAKSQTVVIGPSSGDDGPGGSDKTPWSKVIAQKHSNDSGGKVLMDAAKPWLDDQLAFLDEFEADPTGSTKGSKELDLKALEQKYELQALVQDTLNTKPNTQIPFGDNLKTDGGMGALTSRLSQAEIGASNIKFGKVLDIADKVLTAASLLPHPAPKAASLALKNYKAYKVAKTAAKLYGQSSKLLKTKQRLDKFNSTSKDLPKLDVGQHKPIEIKTEFKFESKKFEVKTKDVTNIKDINLSAEGITLNTPQPGQVNTYGHLKKKVSLRKDGLDMHHMPFDHYMAKYGISNKEGIAMLLPKKTHIHLHKILKRQDLNQNPRQALLEATKVLKQALKETNSYTPEMRRGIIETIRQNKAKHPHMFNKK